MGLFDKIVSAAAGQWPGVSENRGIVEQALQWIDRPEVGGLSGLIDKFRSGGLGDVVSSWVGTGANQAVSGDEMIRVLGNDGIGRIAAKLGISNTEAAEGLASALPQMVDKLTPEGVIPEDSVLKQGLSLIAQHFLKG